MSDLVRLDKYLADMSEGSRSEVKELIAGGRVSVNGITVKNPAAKIKKNSDIVEADGRKIVYKDFEYYMLNKPAGVVSATEDKSERTVLDIIGTKLRKDLFPVGRLDKDTEGLLIITNDGGLAHRLLSPKKHVDKIYYAQTDVILSGAAEELLRSGVDIGDDRLTLPARLARADSAEKPAYLLTICEGRFHQVKRMFKAVGANVTYLKRIGMDALMLDEGLKPGEYRELTEEEINILGNR